VSAKVLEDDDEYKESSIMLRRCHLLLACAIALFANAGYCHDCLWATKPLSSGGGYTWSMASRTGDMLEMAEKLFGPRDMSWTILGAEIRKDDTNPQNWFPGYPRRKDIVFQLAPSATNGMRFACYQLAHEIVHALAPDVGGNALVIEEGVATWFAKHYVKKSLGVDMHASLESYQKAELAVDRLLKGDPTAIRKLRSVQPSFKKMTAEDFRAAGVKASEDEMGYLLSPFQRGQ